MIIDRDQLKTALGITTNENNALLDLSVASANALIAGYIGYDVSDTEKVREYVYTCENDPWFGRGWRGGSYFVHMPLYPVLAVVDISGDDNVPIDPTVYRLIKDKGRIDFVNGAPTGRYLTFHYNAGFDPVPDDLTPVALNLAATVYNNGGQITPQINQLKTLTMFDAMSMSFNTGDVSVAGPDALVSAWAFVLDKYVVLKGPVLK